MNTLDPYFVILIGVLAVAAGAGLTAALGVIRSRRRARRRLVEKPNSHYVSPIVRENDKRHRWHGIDLDKIHEINRAEVVRLLARVEASGAATLRPDERTFLDNMEALAGPPPAAPEPRTGRQPVPSPLMHRPA